MKFYDVFSEAGYHSAFMTTYSFAAQTFEEIPLRRLRASGCSNIVVLADRGIASRNFSDFNLPLLAGQVYHLVKVSAPGAFHPKIVLLAGDRKGKLLVGSANLTASGLAGNRELIASVTYSETSEGHLHHFVDAVRYIDSWVPTEYRGFQDALEALIERTPWLHDALAAAENGELDTGKSDFALVHDRHDRTIIDQLSRHVGKDRIRRLVVLSPYWDRKLKGLSRLQNALGKPKTCLLLNGTTDQFPKSELKRFSKVELYDSGCLEKRRFLHAKLIVAEGETHDHVLSGSINCSRPALLGLSGSSGNAEAGFYKRMSAESALPALGLDKCFDFPIQANDLPVPDIVDSVEQDDGVCVDGGDLFVENDCVRWVPPPGDEWSAMWQPRSLTLLDKDEDPIAEPFMFQDSTTQSWSIDREGLRPRSGTIEFADGTVSAPMYVTFPIELLRETRQLTSDRRKDALKRLDEFPFETLEMIGLLNELEMLDKEDNVNREFARMLTRRIRSRDTDGAGCPEYRGASYDEFVAGRIKDGIATPEEGTLEIGKPGSAEEAITWALNRMIHLSSADSQDEPEAYFGESELLDLTTTEPVDDDFTEDEGGLRSLGGDAREEGSNSKSNISEIERRNLEKFAAIRRSRETAVAISSAVEAFRKRCRSLQGKLERANELVRLRVLVHIVLAHALPIPRSSDGEIGMSPQTGDIETSQERPDRRSDSADQVGESARLSALSDNVRVDASEVGCGKLGHAEVDSDKSPLGCLKVYSKKRDDWPRLVGILLDQHFRGGVIALRINEVQDDSTWKRVIECLAVSDWAARAARRALEVEPKASIIRKKISNLGDIVAFNVRLLCGRQRNRMDYFKEVQSKLDARFGSQLGFACGAGCIESVAETRERRHLGADAETLDARVGVPETQR